MAFLQKAAPLPQAVRTRKEFAAIMWLLDTLRQHAPKPEMRMQATYMFAKGLYNMGYFGNSTYLAAWTRSSIYENIYATQNPVHKGYAATPEDLDYHRAETAEKLFAQVAAQSISRELQAQALFRASLAYKGKTWTSTWGELEQRIYGPYFTTNPYFSRLHTAFASTRYYDIAHKSCATLWDFVDLKK